MPEVHSTILIRAPADRVYELAKDIEGLAAYIADVESIHVVERAEGRTVTEWVGVIREFRRKVKWTEEDHWDDQARVCTFEQIKGDFTVYRGTWAFRETPEGTQVVLDLTYELEIPLIGPLIKRLLHRIVQNSCESIQQGLKERAEQ
ncbi:MAG TPA: SRPBCC family protein [Armatimonadetes bacterium]|nr:SRPBCC family protein [Armatimonadota bacterium]